MKKLTIIKGKGTLKEEKIKTNIKIYDYKKGNKVYYMSIPEYN